MRPLALALLCGCSPAPYDLALSWVFVDGRDCADAGVAEVALELGEVNRTALSRCSAGEKGRSVVLKEARRGLQLRAAALSPAGAVLYRAESEAPDDAVSLELVLTYTGGR